MWMVLFGIRAGWRWFEDGLWFREDWEELHRELSAIERTKRVVYGAMQAGVNRMSSIHSGDR